MSAETVPTEGQRLAAKRGAYLLDERMPGWAKKIDPATLDLARGCDCVLGQTFGEYERGVGALDLGEAYPAVDDDYLSNSPVVMHGFYAGERDQPEWDGWRPLDWNGLRAAWLEQIAERVTS